MVREQAKAKGFELSAGSNREAHHPDGRRRVRRLDLFVFVVFTAAEKK